MSELTLPLMTDTEIVDWLENYGRWIDTYLDDGVALSSLTLNRKRIFTTIDKDLRRAVRRAVAVENKLDATLADSLADNKKTTSKVRLLYCMSIFILGAIFGAAWASFL